VDTCKAFDLAAKNSVSLFNRTACDDGDGAIHPIVQVAQGGSKRLIGLDHVWALSELQQRAVKVQEQAMARWIKLWRGIIWNSHGEGCTCAKSTKSPLT
jgi:hypothetical protein